MTPPPFSVLDTDPHPVFRVYSSGNFGEVAPERLSVIAWSLVGPLQERGFRTLVDRVWPGATWHLGSHYVFVGYFAGRPYHNLAALAHLATEVPGVAAEDLATLYFEGTASPAGGDGLRAGRLAKLALVARAPREFLSLRSRLTELEGRVARLEQGARDALASGSDLRLGAVVRESMEVLSAAWELHMANTAVLVPLHAFQHRLGRRLVAAWEDVAGWLNRPEELVWAWLYEAADVGGDLGPGEFLSSAFYEIADLQEPFASLVRRHAATGGARVPERGRDRRGEDELASALWGMLPPWRAGLLRSLTRAIGDTMEAREASKSLAMRCLHVFRRIVPTVAESSGVSAHDWPYLTLAELWGLDDSVEAARRADVRRLEFERVLTTAPPPLLDLSSTTLAEALARPAAVPERPRRGRGVSPGTAVGVAVTPDSIDRFDGSAPKILVCESADADVEPLLGRVAGLISARGSVLSHIAILVRERRLPGVVGHPLASELSPGDVVVIDGTTGEASIVERGLP